jgi:hypothetical protein
MNFELESQSGCGLFGREVSTGRCRSQLHSAPGKAHKSGFKFRKYHKLTFFF